MEKCLASQSMTVLMLPEFFLPQLFESKVFKHILISILFGLPIILSSNHGTALNISDKVSQSSGDYSHY